MVGGVAAAAVGCGADRGIATVRLASGEVGGLYHAFARLLAEVAARAGTVRIEPVATSGSQANLAMLANGEVDAALALADSVPGAAGTYLALGRVYENYLQLAVRTDSSIRRVADLRGARVNLGATGSGAALTGERILRAAGLDPAVDVTIEHRPLREAVAALDSGAVDALLWAGGVPTAALEVPLKMRLIDLGELARPLREHFGQVYDRVEIPTDAYPDTAAVHTIGIANLLLATAALPDAAAAAIVDLLVTRVDALVPAEAAGTQFLDTRSLIGTGTVPLHSGAADIYRSKHG
ncbi:TAXI family TRAP transporter solute-binding subunit [Nocardia sp. NPDC050710]|uniref:TAXI family TRAP transporter solute-binding subunit n=1 Tax=Nocardia sp. NPDC050710 TaxID=3157220 RepID=UPI0033DC98C5